MVLKELKITNFKMFDDMELSFQEGFNLLLGDNGVGKTTILEAASVALAGFLTGIEDVSTRNIYKTDVRYHIEKDKNGIPNKIYHSPVSITAEVQFEGEDYTWERAKKDAGSGRTTTSPKAIAGRAQQMVNGTDVNNMWPILSYQSAARQWISKRSDAEKKLRKQLHDRRCGYIGCLDMAANMNSIDEWCYQMEWLYVQSHIKPENYVAFGNIIALFMKKMNDGKESRVVYHPSLKKLMYVENSDYRDITDLSAGYQSVLNLVIDIAYRLALLNPDAGEEIRYTKGIVLIDEIDSNLHPKWQWKIVEALTETFPNIQFIAATHSPIIVSSCKDARIIRIDDEKNVQYLKDSYAYTVNEILETMLGKYIRPQKVDCLIREFEHNMDYEEYSKARENLIRLKQILGKEHPNVISMQSEYDLEADE